MPAAAASSRYRRRSGAAAQQHGVEFGQPRRPRRDRPAPWRVGRPPATRSGGRSPSRRRRRAARLTSNPSDTSSSTGTVPASTLRTSTCRPAMWYGGQRQQPGAGAAEPVVGGRRAGDQRARRQHGALRAYRWCPRSTPPGRRRRRCPRRPAMPLSAVSLWRGSRRGRAARAVAAVQHAFQRGHHRQRRRARRDDERAQGGYSVGLALLRSSVSRGSSSGQPLAAKRSRTRSTSIGQRQLVGQLGDQRRRYRCGRNRRRSISCLGDVLHFVVAQADGTAVRTAERGRARARRPG